MRETKAGIVVFEDDDVLPDAPTDVKQLGIALWMLMTELRKAADVIDKLQEEIDQIKDRIK